MDTIFGQSRGERERDKTRMDDKLLSIVKDNNDIINGC